MPDLIQFPSLVVAAQQDAAPEPTFSSSDALKMVEVEASAGG
jgi:hypothetical protein